MVSLHPFSDNDPFKYLQMLFIYGSVSNYLWSVCFEDISLLKIDLVLESAVIVQQTPPHPPGRGLHHLPRDPGWQLIAR